MPTKKRLTISNGSTVPGRNRMGVINARTRSTLAATPSEDFTVNRSCSCESMGASHSKSRWYNSQTKLCIKIQGAQGSPFRLLQRYLVFPPQHCATGTERENCAHVGMRITVTVTTISVNLNVLRKHRVLRKKVSGNINSRCSKLKNPPVRRILKFFYSAPISRILYWIVMYLGLTLPPGSSGSS